MKIGIVTTWFERGAAYVSKLYEAALKEAGHDVYIYARGGEKYARGEPFWDHDSVHWARRSVFMDKSGIPIRDFKKWLLKNDINAVLFNEQTTWLPVIACQDLGVPTVAYIDYYKETTVPLFANYDALICNTKRHYSVFDWHSEAHYIPWGTDTELFAPKNQDGRPVSQGKVTFFHSCGMAPIRKGTAKLIEAYYLLDRRKAHLIIQTQVELDAWLPLDVLEHLRRLKQAGEVDVICRTVSAPGLYYLGDVYVYPSSMEGIGLTVCEALASGLPVIVPDNGPMNEFVDGTSGRLVEIDRFIARYDGYYWPQCIVNTDSLSRQMQYYLDNYETLFEFKKSARDYAKKTRCWTKQIPLVNAVFEKLSLLDDVSHSKARAQVVSRGRLHHRAFWFLKKIYKNTGKLLYLRRIEKQIR